MDKNESKSSLMTQKQPQYSFEAINNLRQISLCHENLCHSNNNNDNNIRISDHIFPFCIANTTTSPRLFSNPNPSPNDDSATDDSRDQISQRHDSDQRRLKRMISNRESARRSRMRRKMQIEELQYLVGQLQTTNRQLSEKLIQLLDCNQQIIQENSQLKEKVSSLQMILADFLVPLGNVGTEDHDYNLKEDDRVDRAQELLLNHR